MTTPLELRFERLLRLYPTGFRRAHGEDMLTTMLADAEEGRRWPRPGDAADIALHALRLRLFKRPAGGLLDSGWAEACALIGPLAAFALLALRGTMALRRTPSMVMPPYGPPNSMFAGSTLLIQTAAWLLVAAVAFGGLRRVAAGLAWVALLAEVVPLARQFTNDPVSTVYALWWALLALVAAAALTVAAPRRPWAVAGRWRLAVILAAPLVMGAIGVVGGRGMLVDDVRGPYSSYTVFTSPGGYQPWLEASDPTAMNLMLLGLAVSGLAGLVALMRLPGPVRRRLAVAVSPVLTMVVLVKAGFSGWAVSTTHMGHAIPLVLGQWAALILLPLLVFLLGAWWVRRRDEILRLAALGARVEREQV